jgi:hypothetical protein
MALRRVLVVLFVAAVFSVASSSEDDGERDIIEDTDVVRAVVESCSG